MPKGCPNCEYSEDYAGLHWSKLPDHRPNFSDEQLEILTGILMGDGTIDNSSKNPRLCLIMTNKEYLEYLSQKFPYLSSEVSLHLTGEECNKKARKSGFIPNATNCKDQYSWRTKTHPQLSRFVDWYDSGEKVWPKDITITPKILKHLFCCDGDKKNGANGRSDYIRISSENERDNLTQVVKMFSQSGIPAPRIEDNEWCRFCWSVSDTQDIYEHMGDPVPGFEYKWPSDI
jgi:hypothetical protein